MFSDTVGISANYRYVDCSNSGTGGHTPHWAMREALTELTGKQAYKYRAFELLITLDLEVYKAIRRIIVHADLKFDQLHKVLQYIFGWQNRHLYDFTILDNDQHQPVARLVPFEDDLEYDESAILMEGHLLSEFLPEYKQLLYTYDMGDNWGHEIQLVRVIDAHDQESPYLLLASGKTPPEDVGGISGFLGFREIILDPDHPEHRDMKLWSRLWITELHDWEKRPRVIHI